MLVGRIYSLREILRKKVLTPALIYKRADATIAETLEPHVLNFLKIDDCLRKQDSLLDERQQRGAAGDGSSVEIAGQNRASFL